MATIVTRAGKGSELTHNEMDANFTNLNAGKAEKTAATACAASRNLIGADVETRIDATSASPIVLTIQTDAIMGTSGAETFAIYQGGTGAASFAAGAGVTLRNTAPTPAQYKTHGVMRVGANEWAYIV